MVCKTNNKNYYINFIAHVVVTCYGTIWQKVLLQFTSCVNWSEYYSNPSAPPLREAIDVWGRARRPPVLAPVQAGGGGRPQGEARRRYQSLLRAPPPVQAERPRRWTMKHGELNETYPDIEGLEHKRRHEELKWDTSQIEWKQINLTVRTLIFSSCSMNKNKCISPLLSSCHLEKIFRN